MALLRRKSKITDDVEKPATVDKPFKGGSGRGHTNGFIELEEFNSELRHPHGQAVYDKMYRTDGDVRQVIGLVCNPAIGGTWAMEPYGGESAKPEDVKIAEFGWWALMEHMRPNLIGHLIEFLPVLARAGFAPGEKAWEAVEYEGEMRLVPRTIALRLPRSIEQFEQDVYGDLRRIKQYLRSPQSAVTAREDGSGTTTSTGDDPGYVWHEAENLVYYRLGAEGDNWEGVSLLRPAYKHWLYKDTIEKIDAIAQEREALGVPICYPPMGATGDQLDEMEDILAAMRTNEEGYIIAPGPKSGPSMAPEGQGWLIEVIGYDRTGSGRDPMPSLEYHTNKIAAAFISEFMRLGHGATGARATAQVQADPFLMSIEAFVTVIEGVLNDSLVKPLCRYNFKGIKNFPKLKMSLVDSTSLAQLADFVLKLTQIGAMMPDQQLEDFLRARADLPPADPEAVKKRGKEDEKIRREIVSPPPPEPGAFGGGSGSGGAPSGKAKAAPGKPHGTKTAPGTNPGARGGTSRGAARDHAAYDEDNITLAYHPHPEDEDRGIYLPRDPHWWELAVDLHGMQDQFDLAHGRVNTMCSEHVMNMANEMHDDETTQFGHVTAGSRKSMRDGIHTVLQEAYDYGKTCVANETQAQLLPLTDSTMLAEQIGARARGGALKERATLATSLVEQTMRHNLMSAELNHGRGANAKAASEEAGHTALKRISQSHVVNAMMHGRHDAGRALAEASGIQLVGARYSAILDRGTCVECMRADDGQVRDLDDPIRQDRIPPNRHCHSNASGHNMCRCFEVYEVMPVGYSLSWTLGDTAAMPEFVRSVADELLQRGMAPSRAVFTAKALARTYCRTGRLAWPGMSGLGLSRSAACDAVSWAS